MTTRPGWPGQNAPDSPATPRLYRGWLMVAIAAFAMVATLPGRTHGLGMITERVLADSRIGLSRLDYAQLNLWATLIGALFCFGIGRWIDRLGSRLVLTAVLLLLATAVLGMSAATGLVTFFAALTLTRGFGQSALSVVSITLVGKWFRDRLGWAMGIYSVLMALGFIATYQAGQAFSNADWRLFWAGIGAALLLSAPIAWLITRDTPESIGLPLEADFEPGPDAPSFTLAEALRTPAFWVFSLAMSWFGMVSAGVALFNESILIELGFDKAVYYEMLSFGVPFGLAAKFASGWLASRISLGKLTGAAMLLLAATLAGLTGLRTHGHVVTYTALSAVAGSAIAVVFFTVWGSLYGRAHLGRIQAAAQMVTVLASAIGPLAFAWSKEATGSYSPALWTSAVAVAMLAVAAWFVPAPSKSPVAAPLLRTEPQPA